MGLLISETERLLQSIKDGMDTLHADLEDIKALLAKEHISPQQRERLLRLARERGWNSK